MIKYKVCYLAVNHTSKKWTLPTRPLWTGLW